MVLVLEEFRMKNETLVPLVAKLGNGAENIRVSAGTRPGGQGYGHEPVSAGTGADRKLCPAGIA